MAKQQLHAVTGAFGFSGKYIARRLLESNHQVLTLTNSLHRPNPFGSRIEVHPFNFQEPSQLAASLEDVSVFYNTYWVRFNYRKRISFTYNEAVENSLKLFDAAKRAGVQRVIHISITNPSLHSPFEYFRDKAVLEDALIQSGLSYSILRPAVLFGKEGILINNIAWMLRKFPLFPVFGHGNYRLQPIHVDDLARLAVQQGETDENVVINAIGPETFTYRQLVDRVASAIGKPRPIIGIPPNLGYVLGTIIGKLMNDIVITRDEIKGLMADLLYVDGPPAGDAKLSDWLQSNSQTVGGIYQSELDRRRK
jgi:NADH dehydrogenase